CVSQPPPPPAETYTLSLHDALPIYRACRSAPAARPIDEALGHQDNFSHEQEFGKAERIVRNQHDADTIGQIAEPCNCHQDANRRSEEHTSELQSRENLVCRLLLEKQ